MKHLTRTALITLSLFAAGCFPDERLWWSPDGLHLAVLTPTGLRLSTPEGLMSAATCEGVQAAAWLPDSGGMVVMRQTEFDNWDAAKALVPAAEAKQIEDLAKGVPDLAAALLKVTRGDEDKLEPLLKSLDLRDPEILGLAYHCALQTNRAALQTALAADGSAKMVKELLETKPSFKVNEIAVVLRQGGQSLGAPKPLVRSLFPLGVPVPSHKHGLVAFTAGSTLRVAALDGSTVLEVAATTLGACAWSADELSFAAFPEPESGRPEVMLLKIGQPVRSISGTWGADIVNAMLAKTETTPTPTE